MVGTMPTEKIACANEPCECMVTAAIDEETGGEPGEAYCSDYCSDSATSEEEENCACGHPACDSP
jgi:hypothetical protein